MTKKGIQLFICVVFGRIVCVLFLLVLFYNCHVHMCEEFNENNQ